MAHVWSIAWTGAFGVRRAAVASSVLRGGRAAVGLLATCDERDYADADGHDDHEEDP